MNPILTPEQVEKITLDLLELIASHEALRAIVDKLSKTEDGVVVTKDTNLWYPCPYTRKVYSVSQHHDYPWCASGGSQLNIQHIGPARCYSTREAAEAALASSPSTRSIQGRPSTPKE